MNNSLSPSPLPHWHDLLSADTLRSTADAAAQAPSLVPLAVWESPDLDGKPALRWVTPCLGWEAGRLTEAEHYCSELALRALQRGTEKSTPGPWGLWTFLAMPLEPADEGEAGSGKALIVLRPSRGGTREAVLGDGALAQWNLAKSQAGAVTGALSQLASDVLAQRHAEILLSRRLPAADPTRPGLTASDREAGQKELLASMNHELRAPLATLQGVALTLREDTEMGPEDREDFLEVMERESGRVGILVDDLLSFVRLETVKSTPKQVPLDARICVAEVAGELRAQYEAAGVSLRMPPNETPVKVNANVSLFHQMTRCLLGNALKFTPKGGEVELRWSPPCGDDSSWVMVVTDNGLTLPKHEQASAFDVFYGSRRAARTTAGAGLGLVLVKRITQAQGWDVSIGTPNGGGTQVTVRIPCA